MSGIIAAGIVPAALEMMDAADRRVPSRRSCGAGLPTDAAAVLLVEVDGLPGGVAPTRRRGRRGSRARNGARTCASRPTRPSGAAVEGPQVGVRRHRADQAQLLPARHGDPADEARRGARAGLRDRGASTTCS